MQKWPVVSTRTINYGRFFIRFFSNSVHVLYRNRDQNWDGIIVW